MIKKRNDVSILMTEITIAITATDYNIITQLADIIWREHYTPIIGVDQVEYMLKKVSICKCNFQSGGTRI